MKKQLITVIVFIVVFGALITTYLLVQNKRSTDELANSLETGETQDNELPLLIEREKSDLVKVVFENNNGTFTILPREKTNEDDDQIWSLAEYPELTLTTYAVSSMVSPLYHLLPDEKLIDSAEGLSEFGLDKPAVATAFYNDGTTEKLLVGNKTPSGDYYYLMREGDPAVYLILKVYGDRFYNGYNEIISKAIAQIDYSSLFYAYVNEKGNIEVELKYPKSKEEFKTELESAGAVYVPMVKPYENKEVYTSYFTEQIAASFSNYSLNKLVELDCKDLSVYGLDDPELTIILEDLEQQLYLMVGNYEDPESNEFVYVRFGNSNNVFLMKAEYFNSFRNINPLKFTARFVAIPYIETVKAINIESREYNRSHDIQINHETEHPEDGTGNIYPTINGVTVDEKKFRNYYQTLIGISIDTEIKDYEIIDNPLLIIKYIYNDGKEDSLIKFYPYNDNFYAVQENDMDVKFLVNKQVVKTMFNYMDSLFEEES